MLNRYRVIWGTATVFLVTDESGAIHTIDLNPEHG